MDITFPPSLSSSNCNLYDILLLTNSESVSLLSPSNSVNSLFGQNLNKTPRVKPFILQSAAWRQIAPSVYNIPDLTPDNTSTKASADGKVWLHTDSPQQYREIQYLLHSNNISFHSFNLPEGSNQGSPGRYFCKQSSIGLRKPRFLG